MHAGLRCFPYCRQSCWKLPGSWEFCLPKLCFKCHPVIFHHLFSHQCWYLEKESFSYIIMQMPVPKRQHGKFSFCHALNIFASAALKHQQDSWLNGLVSTDPKSGRNREVNCFLLRWSPGSQRLFLVTSAQLGFHPSKAGDCATKEIVLTIGEPLMSVAVVLLSAVC